jgi:dihydroflavonol-4-reductase
VEQPVLPLAFVTGATGFLGLNLVERLAAAGWDVVAYHRASSDLSRLARFPVRRAVGDVTDRAALAAGLPAGTDAVFHLAANTAMWRRRSAEQWRDNVGGTEAVLAAARERGAGRFVHVSTASVYGHGHGAIDENAPKTGATSSMGYARSKAAAEEAVKAAADAGFAAVIVNPSHVIGRYDTHNWARLIRMAATGTLPGVPPGGGSFCHAEAVADALIAAAARGTPGRNYLLGGADATFMELVRLVGGMAGKRVPRRPMPAFALRLYAHVSAALAAFTGREPQVTPDSAAVVLGFARVDCRRAMAELGYRAVSLPTMLEDAYRWMKSEGIL